MEIRVFQTFDAKEPQVAYMKIFLILKYVGSCVFSYKDQFILLENIKGCEMENGNEHIIYKILYKYKICLKMNCKF